jgi:hypothetical protein
MSLSLLFFGREERRQLCLFSEPGHDDIVSRWFGHTGATGSVAEVVVLRVEGNGRIRGGDRGQQTLR